MSGDVVVLLVWIFLIASGAISLAVGMLTSLPYGILTAGIILMLTFIIIMIALKDSDS